MAAPSSSSFGSHNPFRRKTPTTPTTIAAPDSASAPSPSATDLTNHASRPIVTPTTPSDFARALSSLPSRNNDLTAAGPPATASHQPVPVVTFQKPKPIKKVRVQSPPPSSPESTSAEHSYPKYPLPPREDDESSDSGGEKEYAFTGEREDPFANEAPPLPAESLLGSERAGFGKGLAHSQAPLLQPQQQQQQITGRGPPPNPFQKTLEDMEQSAREGAQAASEQQQQQQQQQQQGTSAGRANMDVEAFKRLLLTGQGPTPPQAIGDGGSMTETSSISRQSIFETAHLQQETPRTSHENSEMDGDDEKRGLLPTAPVKRSGSKKKPPPPPATRHGKLIKVDSHQDHEARPSSAGGPTDVNKPLPPSPGHGEDDLKNNVFDVEAAGKVPEVDIDPEAEVVPPPRPPTPPNASHTMSEPIPNPISTLRKPMPPPRRTAHGRSESRSSMDLQDEAAAAVATASPRSSMESQRSRPSSLRNLQITAPAPPPPRRGAGAGHRMSPSISSPSRLSYPFAPMGSGMTTPDSESSGTAKVSSPPPLPPQRNSSVRKSSGNSVASSSRLVARGTAGPAPPPPPSRHRGGSKGSLEGPGNGLARTRSIDSVRRGGGDVATVEEEEGELNGDGSRNEIQHGGDGTTAAAAPDEAMKAMLADLDALQREVEAARLAAGGGQ